MRKDSGRVNRLSSAMEPQEGLHPSGFDPARKPFLCRIRLHRWKFAAPMASGCGAYEQCSRCNLRRAFYWAGGYIYER